MCNDSSDGVHMLSCKESTEALQQKRIYLLWPSVFVGQTDSSLSSEFQARTASLNPSKVCILGIHDTQRIGSPAPDCQSGKNAMAKDPKQKVQAHPPRWRAVKETIAPPRTRCHLAHGQPGMPQVHRLRTPAVRSRQPAPQLLWVAHLTWPNCNGAENEKIKL